MKILTEKTARTQNKSPFSLQKIVNYAHSIGDTNITLIELVGKLASFHPMIRKAICQEFNVSLERELDEFLNGKPGNIIKEDYVDLYSAFMQAKTVVPTVAIPEIATVLEEYCIAQRPAIKEKVDGEQAAHDAFVEWSKKLQESQTRQENSAKLFKAISDRDFQAIENDFTLVNPISIIDRSADGLMRTPLMMAMYYHQASAQKEEANPIFKKLLKYSKAVMIRGRRAIGQSDLAATDHTLKTPLMIAIDLGLFNFALRIAQKMEMNEKFKKAFALRNNKGKSALYLAEVAKEEHKSKDDYKALMVILEKHCKS